MTNTKSLPILLFALAVVLSLGSCKKDDVDQDAIDQELIQQYLADHSLVAEKTASGIHYIISDAGDPDNHPSLYSVVVVKTTGYLLNGEVFEQGEFSDYLYSFIKGWQEGLTLIGNGGRIKLIIPSSMGFGDSEDFDDIPPNSVLVFDIYLEQVYNI